jgi:hypothetical protein
VSELDVGRAEPADVDEIVAVLSNAARWLLSREEGGALFG